MANQSIFNAFERMWQHVIAKVGSKADLIHNHDDIYYTEDEVDAAINEIATSKADVDHNHNDVYETKDNAQLKLDEAKSYTDTKTSGLASTSSVTSAVNTHNTSTSAHNDIRELITGLTTRLNTLADSDDTTLDQMSEVVAYIKSNKSLIEDITTNKVNVADIVNNLTTNVSNKPLSAAQGVAIKGLIDALEDVVDGKADEEHTHAIADVSGLQSALDGKAASSHGTHVTWSTTSPKANGTAAVGSETKVARGDHVHPTDTTRASKSDFDSHTGNTSNPHSVTKSQVGLGNVENKSSATIRGEITKSNVTTALGYTPYTPTEVNTLLDGKADDEHTHAIADVTNLQSSLDDKVSKSTNTELNTNVTMTFNTNGIRKMKVTGSGVTLDTSAVTSGIDGAAVKVVDNAGNTNTLLGYYGTDGSHKYGYIGGTYTSPYMKFTPDGQITFKNTPKVGTDTVALKSELNGKADTGHAHNYYGVCTTAADTAAKTVEIEGFELVVGAMVIVKFDNANSASNPTLNVSGTGAKPMYRYGTTALSTGTTTTGWYADSVQMFIYDGAGWIRDYWNNTTYSNASLGQGYGTCSTAAATVAKTASISSYALTAGGIVTIKFTNAVPAGATLNITSKGAKAIYYRGAAITADVIKAGDTATFIYSTYYHLLSIDRWQKDISSKAEIKLVEGETETTINEMVINKFDSKTDYETALANGEVVEGDFCSYPEEYDASDVNITTINGISATNVQDAINELNSKKATVHYGTSEPSSSFGAVGDLYIIYED